MVKLGKNNEISMSILYKDIYCNRKNSKLYGQL